MSIPQNPDEINSDLLPKLEFHQNSKGTCIFKVVLKKNKIPLNLTGLSITFTIFKSDAKVLIASNYIVVTDASNGELVISLPVQEVTSIDVRHAQISLKSINAKEITFPKFKFLIDNVLKSCIPSDVSKVQSSNREVTHDCGTSSIKDVTKDVPKDITTGLLQVICNQPCTDVLNHNESIKRGLQQYAIDDIRKTQAKVVDISTNDTIQFAFVTDLHADDYLNYYDQIQTHLNAVIDIQKYGILDFIAIGGDIHSGVYPDKENPKGKLSELAKTLKESKIPVLVLHGNHDDNSYYVASPVNPVLSNIITKKEWFNRMIRPFMNGEIHDTQDSMSLYYYKDFYDKKIRVICLDSTDYPIIINSDGTMKWHGQNFWGYGARQVQWFQAEALNTLDRTDWSVLVLSHMATRNTDLMFNGYNPYNGNLIEGLLKAFMNGGDFIGATTGDYGVSINANFKSQGPRKILCYVYGHTHTDQNNKPVDLGWNFINTSCCYSAGITTRAKCTNKEDLWDVIACDKITGTIDCFRYGYGVDRHIL